MTQTNARFEKSRKLIECALLIAIATVLSMIKIAQMPYGGSVTIASMLPLVLIAYRHGLGWGLGSGFVYGIIQQLLGLKNLSYVTTWQSVLAVILLDYLVAFLVLGFGGVFRKAFRKQSVAITVGALLVAVLRYLCHTIAGATVWAGLAIPTAAALSYSLIYNATYMLPETIILCLIAFYLSSVIDFRAEKPVRMSPADSKISASADLTTVFAWIVAIGAIVFDIATIFMHLQNEETGKFDWSGLAVTGPFVKSFWLSVIVVSAVACAVVVTLILVRKFAGKKEEDTHKSAQG